jgi:hypothetical protein
MPGLQVFEIAERSDAAPNRDKLDVARSPEADRSANEGGEGKCGELADTGNRTVIALADQAEYSSPPVSNREVARISE